MISPVVTPWLARRIVGAFNDYKVAHNYQQMAISAALRGDEAARRDYHRKLRFRVHQTYKKLRLCGLPAFDELRNIAYKENGRNV